MEIARNEGDEAKATVALERYREIDRQVWASLAESEEELMRGAWVSAAS
jgi:hypothetical protein